MAKGKKQIKQYFDAKRGILYIFAAIGVLAVIGLFISGEGTGNIDATDYTFKDGYLETPYFNLELGKFWTVIDYEETGRSGLCYGAALCLSLDPVPEGDYVYSNIDLRVGYTTRPINYIVNETIEEAVKINYVVENVSTFPYHNSTAYKLDYVVLQGSTTQYLFKEKDKVFVITAVYFLDDVMSESEFNNYVNMILDNIVVLD